jgi:hypothetical protein
MNMVGLPIRRTQPAQSVEAWAEVITQAWRETVGGILGVGQLLAQARGQLQDGDWGRLTGRSARKSMLPFGTRTAERLINVFNDLRIATHASHMPPYWMTLYAIHKLTDKEFDDALDDGVVHPECERKDIRDFLRERRLGALRLAASSIQPNFTTHHCAIEDVTPDMLPDASSPAIITDPPYLEKNLPLFSHLAKFAGRVLIPGGWCVVMAGTMFLPQVLERLSQTLRYRWQFVVTTPGGGHSRIGSLKIFQAYKPVLLFQKPPLAKIREWGPDLLSSPFEEQQNPLHNWQQSEAVFTSLVDRFSVPGDLVVDPFAGSGTTGRAASRLGRQFWGCDVDPKCSRRGCDGAGLGVAGVIPGPSPHFEPLDRDISDMPTLVDVVRHWK